MSPDDPIYDPVREIAATTRALVAILDRMTTTTEDTRDLCMSSLRVARALGWATVFAVAILLVVLVVLALWFQQSMQGQQAYHEREDAKLQQSLHRSEQLLYESRQALQDHQRQMERLAR